MQHCPSFLPAYRNSSVVSSSVEYALQRQQQLSYTAADNVLQEHRFVNKMQAPGASDCSFLIPHPSDDEPSHSLVNARAGLYCRKSFSGCNNSGNIFRILLNTQNKIQHVVQCPALRFDSSRTERRRSHSQHVIQFMYLVSTSDIIPFL